MNSLRKSLSLRLLAIFFLIALLTVFFIAQLFSRGMGAQWKNNIQPHLIQYLSYVHNDVGSPPDHNKALSLSERLPVNIYIYNGPTLEYATNGKALEFQSLHFSGTQNRQPDKHSPSAGKTARFALPPDHAFGRGKRTSYLRVMQNEHTLYYELRRREGRSHYDDHFVWVLLGLGGILLLSYFIIRRQLSPIKKIKQGVSLMSQGDLQHRIPISGNDDLAQLGDSINKMAERIETMLDAKRQLLMAISHELRSPLARSRIANEMLPDSINKQRIGDDLNEMDKLIHEIMESERLQHHTDLHYQTVDLTALLIDVTGNDSDFVQLNINTDEFKIEADDARIRIMLRNLINNALQHGRMEQSENINVSLDRSDTDAILRVTDYGPGIGANHIENLGEPFYRPDESRTRTTGGFGMGLTLVKRIVDTHGGTLKIDSQTTQPSGTTVEVRIPIRQTH
ncbi:MAG: HAMP domain-containing sensor histidine kinase [Granulosicoccaceae bacterium]